jgi:hypothetical protein
VNVFKRWYICYSLAGKPESMIGDWLVGDFQNLPSERKRYICHRTISNHVEKRLLDTNHGGSCWQNESFKGVEMTVFSRSINPSVWVITRRVWIDGLAETSCRGIV